MIDADLWKQSHDYHRYQLRLHHLALHGWGLVEGLEVEMDPADRTGRTLLIQPGLAIDQGGAFVVVGQRRTYRLITREATLLYLVLQYREVPGAELLKDVTGVDQ